MSIKAIEWARDLTGCNSTEKAVLFVLAEAHNGRTGLCCPGQELIAERAGMSDRTLRSVLAALMMKGFVSRQVTSKGRGKGVLTVYTLHLDRLERRMKGDLSNGTPLPEHESDTIGRPFPHDKVAYKRKTASGTKSAQDAVTSGSRQPLHPEAVFRSLKKEPELTGIPSQDSNESFEGRSADLFNHPHVAKPIDKRSPSKPTSRNADPLSAEKDFIFKNGVQLLIAQGCTEQTARTFLGKLVRDWKTKPVAEAIKAAIFEKVGDAKSWIPAALKKRKSELSLKAAPTPETVGADDWAAAIRRWAEDGYWPSARLGLAPNQVGYRGPTKPLEDLLPSLGDHPAAREIRSTINLRASA